MQHFIIGPVVFAIAIVSFFALTVWLGVNMLRLVSRAFADLLDWPSNRPCWRVECGSATGPIARGQTPPVHGFAGAAGRG